MVTTVSRSQKRRPTKRPRAHRRTAIRNQLTVHAEEVKRTVARRTLVLGLQHLTRADLERARAAGQMLHIHVLGLARIADENDAPNRIPPSVDDVLATPAAAE